MSKIFILLIVCLIVVSCIGFVGYEKESKELNLEIRSIPLREPTGNNLDIYDEFMEEEVKQLMNTGLTEKVSTNIAQGQFDKFDGNPERQFDSRKINGVILEPLRVRFR